MLSPRYLPHPTYLEEQRDPSKARQSLLIEGQTCEYLDGGGVVTYIPFLYTTESYNTDVSLYHYVQRYGFHMQGVAAKGRWGHEEAGLPDAMVEAYINNIRPDGGE